MFPGISKRIYSLPVQMILDTGQLVQFYKSAFINFINLLFYIQHILIYLLPIKQNSNLAGVYKEIY